MDRSSSKDLTARPLYPACASFAHLVLGGDEASAPLGVRRKPQTDSSLTSIGAVVPPGGQNATHFRRTESSAPEGCAQLALRVHASVRRCPLLHFHGNRQAASPDICDSQLQVGCLMSPALARGIRTWLLPQPGCSSIPAAILRAERVVVLPFEMVLRASP